MSKIIKTTEGSADFLLNEEYENEDKAIQGKEPANADIKIQELKIENIKYKLKKVINEKS
jgi:hypothetical protein